MLKDVEGARGDSLCFRWLGPAEPPPCRLQSPLPGCALRLRSDPAAHITRPTIFSFFLPLAGGSRAAATNGFAPDFFTPKITGLYNLRCPGKWRHIWRCPQKPSPPL